MKAVPIHEAKANLSKYIQLAKAGKPVYIGARGEAEVELRVITTPEPNADVWGAMRGQIFVDGVDLDELDRRVAHDFDVSEIFPRAD